MARASIYDRMDEIIEEMRGDWKKFFMSDAMETFARHYIANLISGVYDSLRVEGAQITPSLVETEMRKFVFERLYDPNSEVKTAYCSSTDKVFKICVNGAGPLVASVSTVEEKFEVVVGMIIHEVGHRLFTDFPTAIAHDIQMSQHGRWFPRAPQNIITPEGITLTQKLTDANYRKIFTQLINMIDNILEDGYIEEELRSHYPGLASSYLGYVRRIAYDNAPTLTEQANEKDPSNLSMVLSQWLTYATSLELKTGEKDIADFDPVITEPIWNAMDIIDEARNNRSPQARADAVNQLAVMISPLLDEEIKKQEAKQQNQPHQSKPQQGSNSQNGQAATPGSNAVSNAVQNVLNQIAQAAGASGHSTGTTSTGNNQQNTSKSVTDPNKLTNSGLQPTVHKQQGQPGNGQGNAGQGNQQQGANGQGNADQGGNSQGNASQGGMQQSGNGGGLGNEPVDHSAAEHDLNNLFVDAAMAKAKADAEHEHSEELKKEAKELDLQDSPCGAPEIVRAEEVSETAKDQYDKFSGRSKKLAKRLAKLLTKQLKSDETEEYMPWQYSGRKFVAKQYCRDNLKGFAQKKLPTEKLRCRVYVLIDESGSVSGELSNAEVATSIVLEQFCSDMEVPLTIQGYTSGGRGLTIFSYVEEKKIDGQDKYRLTGMSARGGTPTVSAMAYAIARIRKKSDAKNTLLFVITDGMAGDDDYEGSRTRALVKKAEANGIRVVACGIGSDQNSVMSQFGEENFLGIDNLEKMPEKLVEIIRRKIMRR